MGKNNQSLLLMQHRWPKEQQDMAGSGSSPLVCPDNVTKQVPHTTIIAINSTHESRHG